MNPATRIGRTVIFQGGCVHRLSVFTWALCALGLRRRLRFDANHAHHDLWLRS